jgi:hypothetical protein
MRPYDGADYERYGVKTLPPVVQNGLKIPREGAFLAQERINAPPHRQRVASIGVGIDYPHRLITSYYNMERFTPTTRFLCISH